MKVVIAMEVRQEKLLPADIHLVLIVCSIPHCNLPRTLALVSCSDRLVLVKATVD